MYSGLKKEMFQLSAVKTTDYLLWFKGTSGLVFGAELCLGNLNAPIHIIIYLIIDYDSSGSKPNLNVNTKKASECLIHWL